MFIEFFETTSQDRLGRTWTLRHGRFKCDQCETVYESTNNLHRNLKRPRNYCSKQCSDDAKKPGGLSHGAFRLTNMQKYGVNAPVQNLDIRNKMKATNIKRYGTLCSLGNTDVQRSSVETRLQRYGVRHSTQIPGVMAKIAATNIKRYGTINPMNAPEIVAKYDQQKMLCKRIETMRKNKTFGTSKPEQVLYRLLTMRYDCVYTQVTNVNPEKRWVIDFYIKSTDTYIQLDGVYWHGLDRPVADILKSPNPRNKTIYMKWLSDREQDRWFKEHNMKLLRITDKAIKDLTTLPDDLSSLAYFKSQSLSVS